MSTEPDSQSVSVLTANIGNLSPGCRKYNFKPCYSDVERRISTRVAQLAPDLVTFQEALPSWQYAGFRERSPHKIGFAPDSRTSSQRIFGDEYTIFEDARHQYLCTAVRKSFGTATGLQGSFARTTPEFQDCNNGFMVTAVTIQPASGPPFDLVNIHLQSSSIRCRVKVLEYIFGDTGRATPMLPTENILVMGDFNFDPWRSRSADVTCWQRILSRGWHGRPLVYHSGTAERQPPHPTSRFLLLPRTIDFVASNFLGGVCSVLGESPGTTRLDGGRGMDHRGVFGSLVLKEV